MLYTSADGPNASPIATYGQQFGIKKHASFVSNNRALIFGGGGHGVNLDDLGGGEQSDTLWFTRETDFSDGEVTRDGTRLAVNVGYGDDTRIAFMVTRGNPATYHPADPRPGTSSAPRMPIPRTAAPPGRPTATRPPTSRRPAWRSSASTRSRRELRRGRLLRAERHGRAARLGSG